MRHHHPDVLFAVVVMLQAAIVALVLTVGVAVVIDQVTP